MYNKNDYLYVRNHECNYLKCEHNTYGLYALFLDTIIFTVHCSIINLLWSLMSKSVTFRSVSYGPCSHTGVACVASDVLYMFSHSIPFLLLL